MANNFYTTTLTILYSISFFAAVIMFFFSSEKKKNFKTYKRSRYLVGIVFLLYSLLCLLQAHFELRTINKLYAGALSLSVYYMAGILFGYSLIPLLNKAYYNRRRITLDSIRYLLFSFIIAGIFILNSPYSEYAFAFSLLYFFFDILRIANIFRKSYRRCIQDINNFHSEYNVGNYVNWMYKVTILLITYGLSFVLVVYTNEKLVGIFSFVGIFLISYIVISYNNYLIYIDKVDMSQKEDERVETEVVQKGFESISYTKIEKELDSWIKREKFLEEGITIMTLCNEFNTNRTYLSQYINTTYNCSFRDFIVTLRIEEAKKILLADLTQDISEIAENTGFSSTSNFYRSFKKLEHMTPNTYRKNVQLPNKPA